ncbi:hypothetical protein A2769_04070 [Candidatus Daviesbacteria bacterium RIFCSPHIGHO2_01_FULL_37_27]|nr:MAG: hypothetical protein A2769_04070 [Candidatus Daviesbacteria bacterium RIFCSPHIGHO2_01_FULL_37_27]
MISIMPNIDFVSITALIIVTISGFLFFYLQKKHQLPSEPDSYQEKGYKILQNASKKAQAILGMAELDAIKISADTRFYREKLAERFDKEAEIASKLASELIKLNSQKTVDEFNIYMNQLKSDLEKSNKDFTDYLIYLKNDADAQKNQSQDAVKQQILQIFVKFEENLSQFLMASEQRSVQSIELELSAARQLIETYKQQQLKLIDENVIAMLEKTLSLVLAKKMSLQDQVDLVYEALEKAKAEKFII